jgi:hypothetical protein
MLKSMTAIAIKRGPTAPVKRSALLSIHLKHRNTIRVNHMFDLWMRELERLRSGTKVRRRRPVVPITANSNSMADQLHQISI